MAAVVARLLREMYSKSILVHELTRAYLKFIRRPWLDTGNNRSSKSSQTNTTHAVTDTHTHTGAHMQTNYYGRTRAHSSQRSAEQRIRKKIKIFFYTCMVSARTRHLSTDAHDAWICLVPGSHTRIIRGKTSDILVQSTLRRGCREC